MTDRERRVREDPAADPDLDDVEGHGRWDLPGDEQPSSTQGAHGPSSAAPDHEGRA